MKHLVVATFLIIYSLQARAQSWCPPGATWYYSVYSGMLGYDAVVEYTYSGDTILLNTPCKVIKGTFQGKDFYGFGDFDPHTIQNYRTYYTYENNDVVFLYTGAGFDTVVNYNASVGDKWLSLTACGKRFPFKVMSTGTVVINNSTLRSISASYTYTYSNSVGTVLDSVWVMHYEKIQGPYAGSWRNLMFRECASPGSAQEVPFEYYCGYSDSATSLQMYGAAGCRLITGLVFPKPPSRMRIFVCSQIPTTVILQ